MSGRRAVAVLLLLIGAGVFGCGTAEEAVGGSVAAGASAAANGGPDDAAATRRLERQRHDVRAAARDVVRGIGARLPGALATESGLYHGCESAGPETFGSFRYAFRARVDVVAGLATRPYLDQLADALRAAGFDAPVAGRRPSGTTLAASNGEIELTVSEFATLGSYVLLDLAGPCVETPEAETARWLAERETGSILD